LDHREKSERIAGAVSALRFEPQALARAAQALGLRLVVLFGSRARGLARPESDLDLAVLGCPAERFLDCHAVLGEVFRGEALDLVRLEDADALLRHEVLRDGLLLWGDPDLHCELRAYAYRDFVDSADLFALEEALSRKKLARIREKLGAPT